MDLICLHNGFSSNANPPYLLSAELRETCRVSNFLKLASNVLSSQLWEESIQSSLLEHRIFEISVGISQSAVNSLCVPVFHTERRVWLVRQRLETRCGEWSWRKVAKSGLSGQYITPSVQLMSMRRDHVVMFCYIHPPC